MKLNAKKLLLFGFIAILLVGIPATLYLVQQQQEVRSRAEASTTLSFVPESSAQNPIRKNVGDTFTLDVMVDPGKNLVSFVKLEIQYDPDKLSSGGAQFFQPNTVAFPSVLETKATPGKLAITLAVGPDPTKAVQNKVKAGTITFKAIANTLPSAPTLITHGANTQVLSIGPSDQASENVLSSTVPATIIIGGGGTEGTIAPIPSGSPTPTLEVSPTEPVQPQPTDEVVPTDAPTPTTASNPTTTPGGTGGATLPVCNSLVIDRTPTGAAPLAITFTANGSVADGATISKVTFNFGDGQVSDVTEAGGIGTNSVNVQLSHTYNNPGTYQATALLTDSGNNVSNSAESCKQTITVTEGDAGTTTPGVGGPDPSATPAVKSPTPSIGKPGAEHVVAGIGLVALLLIIGGAFLFFAL